MNSLNRFICWLKDNLIPFKCDVDLKAFTYFKSGGSAHVVVYPESVEQLIQCIVTLKQSLISYKVVGETSNLLFLDGKDYGCLVSTRGISNIKHDPVAQTFGVECGAMLPDLSRFALYNSVQGYAGLEGIPGTVGGAIYMNAGAYNHSIDQTILSARVLMPDGLVKELSAPELGLRHRDSIFRSGGHPGIILSAIFKAELGDQKSIYRQMEIYHSKRHKYIDYLFPNLGSLFAGSVYRELGKHSRYYALVTGAYFLLNYRWKFHRRESPINRKWLNDFTVKHFGLSFKNQPFSDKTINSLINNGHHTDEHLDFIKQLQILMKGTIPLENEIVEPF